MKNWKLLLAILSLFWGVGCGKSDKYDFEEILRLTIASVKPVEKEENYDYSDVGCWLPLYICKIDENPQWRLWHTWGPIEGFDNLYEEGYEYVIDIYERRLANTSLPDGLASKYQLKKVISKVKKDSEGIPEQFITE